MCEPLFLVHVVAKNFQMKYRVRPIGRLICVLKNCLLTSSYQNNDEDHRKCAKWLAVEKREREKEREKDDDFDRKVETNVTRRVVVPAKGK